MIKKIALPSQLLSFNPAPIHYIYGLLIKYNHLQLDIHYEIEYNFVKCAENGSYILSINRKQIFINGALPAKQLHQLASELAKCIYPIIVKINAKNEIIDIINHCEIVARAKSARVSLGLYFAGDGAEACFHCFEQQCSNPNTIIAALQNDLFYRIYFFPFHIHYNSELTAHANLIFPIGEKEISYSSNIQLSPYYNEKEKMIVNVQGIDILHTEVAFSAQYELYADDHIISSVTGTADYPGSGNELGKIEFEIYHLNSEERMHRQLISLTDHAGGSNESSLIQL